MYHKQCSYLHFCCITSIPICRASIYDKHNHLYTRFRNRWHIYLFSKYFIICLRKINNLSMCFSRLSSFSCMACIFVSFYHNIYRQSIHLHMYSIVKKVLKSLNNKMCTLKNLMISTFSMEKNIFLQL